MVHFDHKKKICQKANTTTIKIIFIHLKSGFGQFFNLTIDEALQQGWSVRVKIDRNRINLPDILADPTG